MAGRTKHDLALDGIRGLAAEAVLIGHSYSVIFPSSAVNDVLGWFSFSAVLAFFILSGYVITGSLRNEALRTGKVDYLDFGIRRSARIMPPFLFTIALVYLFSFSPKPELTFRETTT